MQWQKETNRFVMVASRFCWEGCPEEGTQERVHAGISFDGVRGVRHRGIDRSQRDRLLALLAVRPVAGAIHLDFAGGATIRLEADGILCHLQDLDEPWATPWRPSHPLDDA